MNKLSELLKTFAPADELHEITKKSLGEDAADQWLFDNWASKIHQDIYKNAKSGIFYSDIAVPENIVKNVYKVAKNQLELLGYKITENIVGAGKPVGITIDWRGKVGAFNNGKGI